MTQAIITLGMLVVVIISILVATRLYKFKAGSKTADSFSFANAVIDGGLLIAYMGYFAQSMHSGDWKETAMVSPAFFGLSLLVRTAIWKYRTTKAIADDLPKYFKHFTELAAFLTSLDSGVTVHWSRIGHTVEGEITGWIVSRVFDVNNEIVISPVVESSCKKYDSRQTYGTSEAVSIRTIGDLKLAIASLPVEMPVSAQVVALDNTAWYLEMSFTPQAQGMNRSIVSLSHRDLHTLP